MATVNKTGKAAPPLAPPSYDESQQQVAHPYPQPHQTTSNIAIVTQPTTTPSPTFFGVAPVVMTCPNCQALITTTISFEPGVMTWLACSFIAISGAVAFCCLVPFCLDSMKDCRHTCPNCKQFLGMYRRV